ncbi:MAG: PAS domain S-box protein [Deltaproteobacteria bacterium]|nr:PAS domain S-box protein [Deltaproteobacteria bacterium]
MRSELYHVTLIANAWFLVACLASVILTIAMGIIFSKNITGRISELIAGARKVSSGKYERIRVGRDSDELSELAATFNQMVDDLVRSKHYSESILESMSDMLFILNSQDLIEQTSQAVLRDLQYSQEELLGKPLNLIFSADTDLVTLGTKLKQQHSRGFVADVVSKAGNKFPVSVSTSLFRSRNGRTSRVMVVKDMSEYKKRVEIEAVAKIEKEKADQLTALNEKLVTTQVQLVQTSKFASLGEMAGGIAHEINNPLAIIHGNAGAIKELAESPDADLGLVRLLAERIENTTMRISKIIRGLRSFARDGEADP